MPQAHYYEVIVGNTGRVYAGSSYKTAITKYNWYVRLSKGTQGRVSGEQVSLWKDNEPVKEHDATEPGYTSNPGRSKKILGVALNPSGKFLGFIDGAGRIRKGRVRRLVNSPSKPGYWIMENGRAISGPYKTKAKALAEAKRSYPYSLTYILRHDRARKFF